MQHSWSQTLRDKVLIWRRSSCTLISGGLGPPCQIVGKARECPFECQSGVTDRDTVRAQCVGNRPDCKGAGNHDHAHLGKGSVPKGAGSGARESTGGVTGDRGWTPKPFLQKMVGEVF